MKISQKQTAGICYTVSNFRPSSVEALRHFLQLEEENLTRAKATGNVTAIEEYYQAINTLELALYNAEQEFHIATWREAFPAEQAV